MKLNKYTFVALAAAALALQSCKKDFLNKQPFNQVADINNADGAERLMPGVYGSMYNDYHIWDYMVNGDVTSDNAYAGGDNPA
ncbi:MAG: RagB/SusD family nutrient uptake outer membrane protein, partial [Pedobacter sp.]